MIVLNLQSSRQILKIGGDYMEWTDIRRKRHWIIKCSVCHRLIGFDMASVERKDCCLDFVRVTDWKLPRTIYDMQWWHKDRHDHLPEISKQFTDNFYRDSRIVIKYENINKKNT